jgi:hypothetical protein
MTGRLGEWNRLHVPVAARSDHLNSGHWIKLELVGSQILSSYKKGDQDDKDGRNHDHQGRDDDSLESKRSEGGSPKRVCCVDLYRDLLPGYRIIRKRKQYKTQVLSPELFSLFKLSTHETYRGCILDHTTNVTSLTLHKLSNHGKLLKNTDLRSTLVALSSRLVMGR